MFTASELTYVQGDEVYIGVMYPVLYCRGVYSVKITGRRSYEYIHALIQLIDVAIPHLNSFLCKL